MNEKLGDFANITQLMGDETKTQTHHRIYVGPTLILSLYHVLSQSIHPTDIYGALLMHQIYTRYWG